MSPFLTDSEIILIGEKCKEYTLKSSMNLIQSLTFRLARFKVTICQNVIEITNLEGKLISVSDAKDLFNAHILGR